MEKERIPLHEKKIFPIIYMILISTFFVAILASIYYGTSERVMNYKMNKERSQILDLFDISYTDNNLAEVFSKSVQKKTKNDLIYWKILKNGKDVGFCFKIVGKGLWGTITAFVATTTDIKKVIGIEFIAQNETPGLGARITEDKFKDQFKGKKLVSSDKIIRYNLVTEDNTSPEFSEIKQITGATASSNAVISMIYKNIKSISKKMGRDYE